MHLYNLVFNQTKIQKLRTHSPIQTLKHENLEMITYNNIKVFQNKIILISFNNKD